MVRMHKLASASRPYERVPNILRYTFNNLFMPPTLKKWGHIGFGLSVCVCMEVRDIVLKLHVWIPHGKICDAYFWFSLNYLPL